MSAHVLLWIPNNPTCTSLELQTIIEILAAAAEVPEGCVVVVDEAYAEFRRAQTPSALQLLASSPNLVVTRTMSKAFALRSEEHTSELQSRGHLVCRLLLEKKK